MRVKKTAVSSLVSIYKYRHILKFTATVKFSKSISPFEFSSSVKLQRKQSILNITSTTGNQFHIAIFLRGNPVLCIKVLIHKKKKKNYNGQPY